MDLNGITAVVTGGASGLGLATVKELLAAGAARVVIIDLPASEGIAVAAELGDRVRFSPADVTDEAEVSAALDLAEEAGPIRVLVHCAARSGPLRLVDRDGNPGSLDTFRAVLDVNVVGTYNVLRLTAARMAATEVVDGERGVCILTASVAAFEGQIGQVPYATSKAAVHGLTIVAARDLASRYIRVCTIAPGTFDTPMLRRVKEEVRESLAKAIPHPSRLGEPEEYARLARHIMENQMLNGETIRIDGAIRMGPR